MLPHDLSSQASSSDPSDSEVSNAAHTPLESALITVDQNTLLATLTLRMRRSLRTSEILQDTVTDLRHCFAADRVLMCRFGSDWRGMVMMESVDPRIPSLLGQEIDDPCEVHDWIDRYRQGQGIAISDLSTALARGEISDAHHALLSALKGQANLIVPVLQDCQEGVKLGGAWSSNHSRAQQSQLWGLLIVQHCSQPHLWQASDLQVLEQVSSLVAIAIRQGDLYSIAQAELIKCQRAEMERKRLSQVIKQHEQHQPDLRHILQQEITQRQHTEAVLAHEQYLAQVTLQAVRDAVITVDLEGEIQSLNPMAERLTGWSVAEAQSQPLLSVLQVIDELSRQPINHHGVPSTEQSTHYQQGLLLSRTGSEYLVDIAITPIQDQDGNPLGSVWVLSDITQSRQMERDLSWHATHDGLTEIMNRRTFEQTLTRTIASTRQTKQEHVLCCLDLDQFKIINDTCGHVAGDQLLQQVTALLKQRVRSTDTLARLSGDEFGILFHQCSLEQAAVAANTLRERLQETPFTWQGKLFNISASIGLVSIDARIQDAPMALSAADAACFSAKGNGRNCVHIYRSTDEGLVQQRYERQWITRIHRALEEGRFCLYGQPIHPLTATHPDIHYEVLLRLVESNGNLVLPMNFIPAAERYDLMPTLDRWVISTFCRDYQTYRQTANTQDVQYLYNINLSGSSINSPQFLTFLQEQLVQYQIPPETICFEITETAAISDLNQAADFIQSLRQLGCSFALDDFGQGMSSLAYLKSLSVDYLKIDGGFIKQLVNSHTDAAIVDCFNHLSHELGISTIAECVENDITLKRLQKIGVDYVQGFGIAMPQPLQFARAA
jgi:diguanylate cyclase (GGDEF)-like protein/PAS domain S-box-containing protein